jgi:phosphatidylserine/phosphatidylglycerophosphate/cardiolipin synthase-like enzyme
MNKFEKTVSDAAPELGASALTTLADRVAAAWPDHAIISAVGPGQTDSVRSILAAGAQESVPAVVSSAFLRGVAAGYARRASSVNVETVWSGPNSHPVPVRATAQALVEVIAGAQHELLLMTYSAKPHNAIRDALTSAASRGVVITVVVETLQGAGSALAGSEPAAAFAGLPGIQLWHWPVSERTENGSKMHAKLAVADQRVLLVSSANLTQSGVAKNIEAGLLVRGGTAPRRAAEHISELKSKGILHRLAVGTWNAS